MATFTKILLSGSTNGRNIEVTATTTPGTLLHTAVSGITSLDEIYIFAFNTGGADQTITIEFGGVTTPDDLVVVNLESYKGAYLIIPGWLLNNSLVVRAFSDNNAIVNGYVHRIVP